MINKLKDLLEQEQKAKKEAMKPYNQRIKNLKTAIYNLERFNIEANKMAVEERPEPNRIEALK